MHICGYGKSGNPRCLRKNNGRNIPNRRRIEHHIRSASNNHIYVRTNAIYNGVEVSDSLGHSTKEYSNKGTVYLQTPSSDNERGVSFTSPLKYNKELIRARWTEGPNTVGAMHISVSSREMKLVLLNRNCKIIDSIIIKTKKKHKLE